MRKLDRAMVGTSMTWLTFVVFAAGVAGIGFVAFVLAAFFGSHDSFGVELYAGAAIGTTGAYALIGYTASPPPIRKAATMLAVLTAFMWLAALGSFINNPGWNF
jgi:hypothetical protein